MNEELETALASDYPSLFELYDADIPDDEPAPPIATYGCQCDDGWYDLIDSLCETLTQLGVDLTVHQIKEKFAGLRFYHGGVKSEDEQKTFMALGAIRNTENMSRHICEVCGDTGEIRHRGYMKTLCDGCHEDRTDNLHR